MKCKAVCDEITHVFQIKTFLLKFLVGERFRVDSHSLHYQFIVVWSRHLVLASTFAFHEEGVYFIVLQDWTSQFIVVWANTSSWPWALILKLRHCMLSHMNEVDPLIFCSVLSYEIQNCIFHVLFQQLVSRQSSISCLQNVLSEF